MSTVRFVMLALGLFALVFIGVSWGRKGFPLAGKREVPMARDARIPTFDASVKKGLREDWENSKTSQSDGDPGRDRLRLELLQAANAYKLSPCDDAMKTNLVRALALYTSAWHDLAYCRPRTAGCPAGEDARLDAASASFRTPADVRAHVAVGDALDQGGISLDDFPKSLRDYVFMWSGMPFGEPEAACIRARAGRTPR